MRFLFSFTFLKRFLTLSFLFFYSWIFGQVTTDPICFKADQEVRIIYDATLGTSGLVGASKVYIHTGVVTDSPTGTAWQRVVGNWGADDGVGLMTKVAGETDKWEITLTPNTYYSVPSNETVYRLAMVFRNADGSKEGKNDANGDIYVDVAQTDIQVILLEPQQSPIFVDQGDLVQFTAESCGAGDFTLLIDDAVEATATATTQFSYAYTVTAVAGSTVIAKVQVTDGVVTDEKQIEIFVRVPPVNAPRPNGIIDGINYDADPTKVTLSVWAPLKSSVFLVGDFNNWQLDPAYQMKKDGEHFWLELTGLTENVEYGYQYLVDETIWIADPYADKILDPDDIWIPASTYPNLKAYPEAALHEGWADNRVAVFQTAQQPYSWQVANFQKPAKEDLIVYELLVRDFLGEQNMNYQALIDTLGYIEDMGVNAIELMPIMEFSGNDSWGYNPTFMFAVDKAYGAKNDLKAFIDEAHSRGMAVILDMVMNQNEMPSPYVKMYFDGKPTAENPWFNRDATHPYNVFYDINHESNYTQTWLDSINHYWLNEFKFDGFRFDLSKGFTQTNNPNNVGAWGNRDDSRIAILERMADKIWTHTPDAYVILEHFADNSEETILADYGMMLWGNAHWDYKDANLGFTDSNSLSWAYYKSRNWQNNHLISYMESHDEQRQMYEMENFGNSSGDYNIKETRIALNRLKMSASFFFTVPGPKMFWQFGEFGYDVDIDHNGRTGKKPAKWEYLDDPDKRKVQQVYTELIGLRHKYDVFTKGDFTWSPSGSLKSIHMTNGDTSVVILGNFGVTPRTTNPNFQHTGTWYDFFNGTEINVTDVNAAVSLGPGQFHIYTDKQLHMPESDLILGIEEDITGRLSVYPNPALDKIVIDIPENVRKFSINIIDLSGRRVYSQSEQQHSSGNQMELDISHLKTGAFVVEFITREFKVSNLIYKN